MRMCEALWTKELRDSHIQMHAQASKKQQDKYQLALLSTL